MELGNPWRDEDGGKRGPGLSAALLHVSVHNDLLRIYLEIPHERIKRDVLVAKIRRLWQI